jgi:predicted CoA-binding protein
MKEQKKKTVVLGASDNPSRYSYLAVQRLSAHNHPVVAIGRKEGNVDGTAIITEHPVMDDVDTVTLYLNPQHQKEYYDYILSLHPKRVIFNPGAENEELFNLVKANGIEPFEACTLVLLSTGQY